MNPLEDAPLDVQNAKPVEDEVKKGELDDVSSKNEPKKERPVVCKKQVNNKVYFIMHA